MFKPATKKEARLRMAFVGPAGSGKTYSSLAIAKELGDKIAVIDTERGSASKYADHFGFDVLELQTFSPAQYVEAIKAASDAGYDVLVIDSLSHAWMGKDGALEQVDAASARSRSANTYFAWREVTPEHNRMVDAILGSSCHVIVTMRAKTEYVIEEVKGKQVPRKIGMAPIQRDGLEYEFDVVGDLDHNNLYVISKTRCSDLQGKTFHRPGPELAGLLKEWLTGEPPFDLPAEEIEAWKATIAKAALEGVERLEELKGDLGALPECNGKRALRAAFSSAKKSAVREYAEQLGADSQGDAA